jgi:hypothetical protein
MPSSTNWSNNCLLPVWTFSLEMASAVSGQTIQVVSSESAAMAAYRAETNGSRLVRPVRVSKVVLFRLSRITPLLPANNHVVEREPSDRQ